MAILRKTKKLIPLLFIAALVLSLFVAAQTASADLCGELSKSTGGFFSCGEGETTFTKFEGGLQQPSVEGYDPTLTQETNLRDFIVNVVNFVLGFLGLVAIIVIIYGGFMYLTAGGAEEKTTKGKKSVMYAIVGIVIVLISFALVNTVIKGIGRGTDIGLEAGELPAAAPEELTGEQTQALQRLFFYAASQVQRAAENLATSYGHYVDVDDAIADLHNVPVVESAEQVSIFLNSMKRSLRNIISASGELSRTAEQAKQIEDIVDGWLRSTASRLDRATTSGISDPDYWKFWQEDPQIQDFQTGIIRQTEGLEEANLMDFDDAVGNVIEDLEDLNDTLEESGFIATEETEYKVAYDRAIKTLKELKPFAETGVPTNQKVVDALEALSDLHTAVQNIKFVASVITTDVDEGNAPLIVNVDALGSIRPDFQSISEGDIAWDFGDGFVVEERFATSHVYRKTGSYIIKLTIKGDPAQYIASGTAYKTITVKPPKSQINLKAAIGDRDLGFLSKYKDGFLIIDKNRLNVTLTEARDTGITFDASETIGGQQTEQVQEAGETYIQTISWTFGDGSDRIYGEMVAEDVQTHYYGEEGTYPVIIEVTDSRGIKDRKVFEVVVDSPAARINIDPSTRTVINEEVAFDGGMSSSDGGQIVGYNWNVQNPQIHYAAEESTESFRKTFEDPGMYNVSLQVTDNLGESATDSADVTVESQPPSAKFLYNVPDPSKPHIYFLDGTQSYDPDGNILTGNYSYKWTIAAIDDDYDFVDENGEVDPEGDTKNRTYLKFYRTGDYKVTLDVDDLNEPENPGVPEEQTINVDNILDVAFDNLEQAAAILDENSEAVIDFVGISENGIGYEWDFGDGTATESGDIAGERTEVSHTYTASDTYDVRLTVFDITDNENTIKRRITIGEADSPIAVIALKVDGNEIYDLSQPIEINRKTVVELNAERSLNRDGTGRRLGYQFDFGDGEKSTQKSITHVYGDLGSYTATLKVLDKNDLTKTSTATVQINVIGELPTLQAFTAVPQQTDLTTPVRVKLDAIGAKDPDGQISKYLWWYYNVKDPSIRRGQQNTTAPQGYVTIGTIGIEGEEMTYGFGLQMTDQENYSVNVEEILSEGLLPSLTVINGPNEIPVARFNVDRTSIMVGETINFTSSSYDPDGRITEYIWDFEGDGFGNNKATNLSTIAHTYETPAVDGINVRLKVVDDNFAESISPPVKIFIDTEAEPPTAAFKTERTGINTISFINNSYADEENGAQIVKYIWDFDISSNLDSADSDGDGNKDNDTDSQEEEPQFTYLESAIYRAKLIVEDNFGNSGEVINFVNVKGEEEAPVTTAVIKANFITNPPISPADNAIHLTGDFDEVRFDFTRSQGDIVRYVFDNNVYIDSNENGRKADDIDYVTTKPGFYTTTFNSEADRIKVRLTVYDAEGNFDIKEVKIVFSEGPVTPPLGVSVLDTVNHKQIPAMVVSLVLFAIVSLSLYFHSLRLERVRIRDIWRNRNKKRSRRRRRK